MLDRFGKTLVILVTELDTGRERQLTPQSDPDLPVRVAVRMSMGIPGICEPFRYENHVYCDGGMCNDFPLNALPEGSTKLGLMVRPKVRPKPARILISQADPQPSPAKLAPMLRPRPRAPTVADVGPLQPGRPGARDRDHQR